MTPTNSYLICSSSLPDALFQMTTIWFYANPGGICETGFQNVSDIVEYTLKKRDYIYLICFWRTSLTPVAFGNKLSLAFTDNIK